MSKLLPYILFLFFLIPQLFAQTTIKGHITDKKGEALPGANIFIKGVEKNLCLNKSIVFNDSIPVPDEFLRPADGPIRP